MPISVIMFDDDDAADVEAYLERRFQTRERIDGKILTSRERTRLIGKEIAKAIRDLHAFEVTHGAILENH